MSKQEFDRVNLANLKRYNQLFFQDTLTQAEQDELNDLRVMLTPYFISATDWNDMIATPTIPNGWITDSMLNSSNKIGDITTLTTTNKTNVVNAINEVKSNNDTTNNNVGLLSNLTTTDKSNIVNSVNEINAKTGGFVDGKYRTLAMLYGG